MKSLFLKSLPILAACVLLASGTANAATITETFTISTSTSLNTDGSTHTTVFSSLFAPFPAADGTLTSIDTTLAGSATWSSVLSSPDLHAVFSPPFFSPSTLDFTTPGIISFSLSGNTTSALILGEFTGIGMRVIDLNLTELTSGTPADTFSTDGNGLSGTITFNFTPTTPLPAALPLFATGLGAIGLLGWRRKRKAQAVA